MAELFETQNQSTEGVTSNNSASSSSTTIHGYSGSSRTDAIVYFNGQAAPPKNKPVTLLNLPTSEQIGWKAGGHFRLICCVVGTQLLEKNTAYDYVMMANAALKDGFFLRLNDAFRTMEEQTRIYNERQNPAVAAKKGKAAKPGTSNHQGGIAADIAVGLTKNDYISGIRTPTFEWLVTNAAKFGFDHVEGDGQNEPWHWTHLGKEIVGVQTFQETTNSTIILADTAAAAGNIAQSGILLATNFDVHDKTTALLRASGMTQTKRSVSLAEAAKAHADQCNSIACVAGAPAAAAQMQAAMPKGFDPETTRSLVYNFDTGLWGDDRPV